MVLWGMVVGLVFIHRFPGVETRGECANLNGCFVPNEVDVSIPRATVDNGNRADWPIDGIRSRDMHSIWGPGTATEVRGQGGVGERRGDGMFQNEIVHLVVGCGIGSRGGESEDTHSAIIASCRKVLVRRVECDSLDVTLVHRYRLELLKSMTRPHDDLRVQSDRDQNRRVMRPSQILHIIVMAD